MRAAELQQALETDIYIRENNHQVYVALFKSVISLEDFRITIYIRENNHQVYVSLFKSVISIEDFRVTIYIIDLRIVDYREIVKV